MQKQFVAAAVLLLVEDGVVDLDDDVRDHIPELADYGHTVTVDHLLTHTGGIRDWTALLQLSSESADALTLIARQRGLNFAPGEEWSYSNSGYVLLKELIARATGMPVSAFARTRLFEPLGMTRTLYADDVRDVEDRALAYEKDGDGWRLDILVGDDRGDGGALLSTASDLLRWNRALTDARLGSFVTGKLHEPARLNNGRVLPYARGLFLDDDPDGPIVWHTGSAAAYKSSLVRLPSQGVSLAILCNAGDSAPGGRFANPIVDMLVPYTRTAHAGSQSAGTAGAAASEDFDVSGKAGLFFSEGTGEPLRLVPGDDGLRVDGGPPLVTVSADRFRNPGGRLSFRSADEFNLRFVSPDRFVLTSMEGEETPYRRAQPYAPTREEMAAFVGRYESDELGAVLEVALGDDGLTIRLNGSRPFPFQPVDRDVFQLARMLTRFHRDDTGRVTELEYSNPVIRGVRFLRRE